MSADDEPEVAPGWLPPRPPGAGDAPPPPRWSPGDRPLAPPPPATGHSPLAPPPAGRSPLAPPPAGEQGRTDPLATTSLVTGILGLVLLALSLGLGFLLSVPLSIVAWRAGASSRRRIAEGRFSSGSSLAQAGFWLGIAGIALAVAGMIVWSILVANGLSLEEFQRDLERELERRQDAAR